MKSIKTAYFTKERGGYQPKMCYEISPKIVEDNIKAFAKSKGATDTLELDKKGRIRNKGDIDQLLVALVSQNMKDLDLTLMHPEITWRRPEIHKLKPKRLFAGVMLKSEINSSNFGDNLTTLKLRGPALKVILLSRLAPVLGLQNLRRLTLQRVSSTCSTHSNISPPQKAFADQLKKVADRSCITALHLLECSFTSTDLELLLKRCPKLINLHWRVDEKCAFLCHDAYTNSVIEAKDVVATIVKSKLALKVCRQQNQRLLFVLMLTFSDRHL